MKLSDRQAHVLRNLDCVKPLPYRANVRAPIKRYQLDGTECTAQITGLVVKGLVEENGHRVRRIQDTPARQLPSLPALQLIRDTLMAAEAHPGKERGFNGEKASPGFGARSS